MGIEDAFLADAGLLNVISLAVAAYAYWKLRGRSRTSDLVLMVLLVVGAIHLATDLVADLGEHNEHLLMHVSSLAVAAVFVATPKDA
ncbi:MAG: hypothetical protein HY556_10280 [Euryarchaeota archaeon]|nr:hypothetical protein [Euryarchaeota archaeon]